MLFLTFGFFCLTRAFDVELLYIAQKLKIPISEIAVNWTEIEGEFSALYCNLLLTSCSKVDVYLPITGSKVIPVWSWLQMGRDLVLIWLRYQIGAWKLKND